jgi:hypothetical protein
MGLSFGDGKDWQQQGCQNADDGYHHQQLNQGKGKLERLDEGFSGTMVERRNSFSLPAVRYIPVSQPAAPPFASVQNKHTQPSSLWKGVTISKFL